MREQSEEIKTIIIHTLSPPLSLSFSLPLPLSHSFPSHHAIADYLQSQGLTESAESFKKEADLVREREKLRLEKLRVFYH